MRTLNFGICIFLLLCSCAGNRKVRELWIEQRIGEIQPSTENELPEKYSLFKFDTELLKEGLKDTGISEDESLFVQLPDPDGEIGPFKIWKSQVVSPKLLKKYPSLASYKGYRTSDINTKVRLEMPESGMQVMVSEVGGTWYISPFNIDQNIYMLYYKSDLKKENTFWEGKIQKN